MLDKHVERFEYYVNECGFDCFTAIDFAVRDTEYSNIQDSETEEDGQWVEWDGVEFEAVEDEEVA